MPPYQQQYEHQRTIQHKKGTSAWLILLIIVVVLGLLGGGLYYGYETFFQEAQISTPTPPTTPETPPPPANNPPPVDTVPPSITDIVVSPTDESIVVTWTTDEPATGQVEYGKSTDYSSTTALNKDLSTSHKITINWLETNTTYHFRIMSEDSTGNQAFSEDNKVLTLQQAVKREVQIIVHNLVEDSIAGIVWGLLENTGEVSVEVDDITIFIEYESYMVEGQSYQKNGSVVPDPAILEPGQITEFNISLELYNVKPNYNISLTLSPE
jgi:hypothetical protein